uniref:Uncharacterized protein n=1 Tax=Glossina austeni TaxID=7395 RepID=A0A1A9VLL4_GLOAU
MPEKRVTVAPAKVETIQPSGSGIFAAKVLYGIVSFAFGCKRCIRLSLHFYLFHGSSSCRTPYFFGAKISCSTNTVHVAELDLAMLTVRVIEEREVTGVGVGIVNIGGKVIKSDVNSKN